ncbi:MAG: N-6 DNA methylase, partial [Anaerolineae bacterium]
MPQVTEWELTGETASRINLILQAHPELPFKEARVEERARGSLKRRDLTLYNRAGTPVLTGEAKMPDSPDGRTPFQQGLVEDAHRKADAIGVAYNFTWNVNRLVLWNTYERNRPISQRALEHYDVLTAPIHSSDEVRHPRVQTQLNDFWERFLTRYAALLAGDEPLRLLPLDEKFIVVYEASLEQPVAQTLAAISERYAQDRTFKRDLDAWMRDKQQWLLSSDEEVVRENLDRAAKFSCYVTANKIVFYKALRRRFETLKALKIPRTVTTGQELAGRLQELFDQARRVTRDYETVFSSDFGDALPFLHDQAAASWRELSEQTDGFDFTQLGHEIVGLIFTRLLSTEERHKFGQHYTRSEVVDLINAFCIRTAETKVMDPSCGGGTFVVRGYARKKALSGGRLEHRDLIRQLYGFDISAFAVNLTTINLVTRDLIDEANYPLVAQRDFFKVHPGDRPFTVPFGGQGGQMTLDAIEQVDAVVGNPPYIRQEKIGEYYGGTQYKRYLQEEIAEREAPGVEWSGRSDIHVFFFPHAATFLRDGGYLGLLTSSNWLDTTYGFRLQKYLLEHFEIVAIIESASEPWFTGARVTTAATILRKQADPEKRAANVVHFVKLERELSQMLARYEGDEAQRKYFERFRDHVERLVQDETTDEWRIRCVKQDELYRMGQARIEVGEEEDEEGGEEQPALHEPGRELDDYFGYKWGIFLRAPEVFFKLKERAGERLVPFGKIAEIRFGVKSGVDDFFFPEDITDEELARLKPHEFKEQYGLSPRETEKVRVIRSGDGSAHLIEARFLEPLVFNLMEVRGPEIKLATLKHRIVLCSSNKDELKKKHFTHILDYIRWGEKEGFSIRSTCASRNLWYDVTIERRGDLLWTMIQQYRHVVALNTPHYVCNHNMFDVFSGDAEPEALAAVLNSTIVAMNKHQFGRYSGREGALKTEVVDVNMMLVPDVRKADRESAKRLRKAFASMRRRDTGKLVDVDGSGDEWSGELAMADRQELDDAVLELLGIGD